MDYLPAIIALSEIYRKKGEHSQSLKILQEAQKREVDSVKLQSQLVKVYIEESQFKEAANLALEIIEQSTP